MYLRVNNVLIYGTLPVLWTQQGVSVIADDTDVFIILIHHYLKQISWLWNPLSMADLLLIYAVLSRMEDK